MPWLEDRVTSPRKTRNENRPMEQILLPQHYLEDTKIESLELFSRHNKNEDQIGRAYLKDTELQKIQNTLEKGEEEMKEIALGQY